jgi:adenylyltransferase/sulfurtransferase
VREPHQFAICSLPGAVNIPLSSFPPSLPPSQKGELYSHEEEGGREGGLPSKDQAVYVMCRRGVLSREATRVLLERGWKTVWNVRGGLVRWKEEVEGTFPMY